MPLSDVLKMAIDEMETFDFTHFIFLDCINARYGAQDAQRHDVRRKYHGEGTNLISSTCLDPLNGY